MLKNFKNLFKNKKFDLSEEQITLKNEMISVNQKPNRNITYHPNGKIKDICPLNLNGNLDGWMIIYDETGNEVEKKEYRDGICYGNPFEGKSSEEMAYMLPMDPYESDFLGEPDSVEELDYKKASTLLRGEKYYGKEETEEENLLLKLYDCSNFRELVAKIKLRDDSVKDLVEFLELDIDSKEKQ